MIYFVTAREIGRVKIGFSDAPLSRFVKMRTDSPSLLVLERVTFLTLWTLSTIPVGVIVGLWLRACWEG